jgi:enoyl-[acyl-carrier protein] reductase II
MIWCAGWELAAAVSNAGGLGLIGAGSMNAETLKLHIDKARRSTSKPFGVNVPLIYPHADEILDLIIREQVGIVFTSAGNPKKWTSKLKAEGITVAHVVASRAFAIKCEEAGVDAVVAEGFEAGGHNGINETTTLALIPDVRKAISLPLIAAGGIGSGAGILAALALGADGVQMGTRFAASTESSAHHHFKNEIVKAGEGDTRLMMKQLIPVRLLKNAFYRTVEAAENAGATRQELMEILGRGRARLGMFDGELDEGELEIGQVSASIRTIQPVSEIFRELIEEFHTARARLADLP